MKKELRKETKKLRRQWVFEKWNEYKSTLSMQDIAGIFGVSVGYVHGVIKNQSEKQNENN